MSASVNFPVLTDEVTLWATRQDAEDFFSASYVSDATTAAKGVVSKMSSISYTNFTSYDESGSVEWNISGNTYELPEQVVIDELKTKLLTLSAAFNSLLTKLRNAGILES